MNRLDLNFKLNTNTERAEFVREYLSQEPFVSKPPTAEESETIANYILWGKDPKTGLNPRQDKTIQLETRWAAQPEDSLDALLETPGFSETLTRTLNEPKTRIPREVFSRAEARREAPPVILEALENLWRQIDILDLQINYYDLEHEKRINPPRDVLLARFTEEERAHYEAAGRALKQYKYLKMRHLIIELRREQFTLRDSYKNTVMQQEPRVTIPQISEMLGNDIALLPVKYDARLFGQTLPYPDQFTTPEISRILYDYWRYRNDSSSAPAFDFREPEHIYQLFLIYEQMEDAAQDETIYGNVANVMKMLKYYIAQADLTDIQRKILEFKIAHVKNEDIRIKINELFQKTYTANYISTIFKQKIIPKINLIAAQHAEIIENLCYAENFKKCTHCGRVLLINADNFVKKSRSIDGFSNRCKRCDKLIREQKKQNG